MYEEDSYFNLEKAFKEEIKKPYYNVFYLDDFKLPYEKLDVSAIVSTFNRCPFDPKGFNKKLNPLMWCLRSLLFQKPKLKEIIVVDDASQDYTKEVVDSFKPTKFLKFKRLLFPASLPSLMTGTITAWGGGWNALIIAEYISLQGKIYSVPGIGSILNTSLNEDKKGIFIIALLIMVFAIFSINHFVYRPLYAKISERFTMEV